MKPGTSGSKVGDQETPKDTWYLGAKAFARHLRDGEEVFTLRRVATIPDVTVTYSSVSFLMGSYRKRIALCWKSEDWLIW